MQDVKLTNAYKIKIIFLCKLYFLISTISNWKRDFTCWWYNFPISLSHSLPFLHPLLYSFHWSAFPSYWNKRPTSFHFPSIIPMFSPSDYQTLHHYLLIGKLNDSLDFASNFSNINNYHSILHNALLLCCTHLRCNFIPSFCFLKMIGVCQESCLEGHL